MTADIDVSKTTLGAPEAAMTAIIDGALAGVTLFYHFVARGDLAWSTLR
jgi:hypothetical protein